MVTPESRKQRFFYDFEICEGFTGLKRVLATINDCGYELVSVETITVGNFLVFFRRLG